MNTPLTVGLAALLLGGCDTLGLGDDRVCTEIGCTDGITVHLAALPTAPYKVEVLVQGTGIGGVSYAYECAGGSNCQQDIFFPELVLDRIVVQVTTVLGSRVTEVINPVYTTSQPNGPNCPPVCRRALVTAELPG